ncbi:MAG: hemolysin family protein, partial [Cyanobacteria bacterium REEB65]|nr:hemolysin family protein [Cyanobacteria bacterium REEB65]
GLVRVFGKALALTGLPPSPFVTDEEIRMLADVGEEEGTIESDEKEMIHGVLELGDTRVREIMVPRIDMECLSAEATLTEALDLIVRTGHSRIPVFRDTSDNIVGILYAKDLLPLFVSANPPRHLPSAYVRPATYIPESKRVDDLLTEMRRTKNHLVIVMDEYGGTAGLVTIEDILEEIVGEIQDEYDTEEELPIQHQPDGSIVVDGKLAIDEVNELLDVDLPTGEFDTIGGFVVGQLGRAPSTGEEVIYDGLRLVAQEVEARRLLRVHIYRTAPELQGS